jgi:hypothetical protein
VFRYKSAGLVLILLASLASTSAEAPRIDSFYIVMDSFSDVSRVYGEVESEDRLLDVVRVDDSVRVRLIRFTWRVGCEGSWVDVAERVIPRTTVAALSEVDLCAMDEKKTVSDLKRSENRSMIVFAGENYTIVAACQGRVKVFHLPDRDFYNINVLRSHTTRLRKQWRSSHTCEIAFSAQRIRSSITVRS